MENCSSSSSNIIMFKDFENGKVKCIDECSSHLKSSEKALKPFKRNKINNIHQTCSQSFADDVVNFKEILKMDQRSGLEDRQKSARDFSAEQYLTLLI